MLRCVRCVHRAADMRRVVRVRVNRLPLLVTNSASRRLAHTYRCGTRPRPAHHRFRRSATAPTTVTSYPLS
eukprot:3718602-Prymnesium_polylepis.1